MSTLKVTNIQDTAGGNSSTSEEIYSGRAKVWVNFNGSGTVAIRADFNVNTITDNTTGNYTVNFTTAMADANYCVSGLADQGNVAGGAVGDHNAYMSGGAPAGKTTSSVRVYCVDAGTNGYADPTSASIAIFR